MSFQAQLITEALIYVCRHDIPATPNKVMNTALFQQVMLHVMHIHCAIFTMAALQDQKTCVRSLQYFQINDRKKILLKNKIYLVSDRIRCVRWRLTLPHVQRLELIPHHITSHGFHFITQTNTETKYISIEYNLKY